MTEEVTIDLITEDASTGEFVLYLVESPPWPNTEQLWRERLLRIQNRVLAAVDIVVDGDFLARYPDSSGRKVRIQVDTPEASQPRVETLVDAVGDFLRTDPSYADAIRRSSSIRGLRLVTGDRLGRFQSSRNST